MGSGVILRNNKGEMLILKTTYKDYWEIPGGVVEENESPRQAATREVLEELGLLIKINSCLVIHYAAPLESEDERIMFVFDAGTITNKTNLKLDKKEILEARFVSFKKAKLLVGKRIASRLPFCEKALKKKKTIYLESIKNIKPIEI